MDTIGQPSNLNLHIPQSRHHHRFNRVHTVFRLVKHNACRAFKHVFGNFHAVHAKGLVNPLAHFGVAVVERRQAMHKLRIWVASRAHQIGIHLERFEQINASAPRGFGFAHT